MRIFLIFALTVMMFCGSVSGPAFAGTAGNLGGIEPISPQEFAGKLGALGDSVHEAASPLVDALAKLGIGLSAVLLILVIIVGRTLIGRIIGGLLTIALGILLWYGAPYIVGMVKGAWLLLPVH